MKQDNYLNSPEATIVGQTMLVLSNRGIANKAENRLVGLIGSMNATNNSQALSSEYNQWAFQQPASNINTENFIEHIYFKLGYEDGLY